MSHKEALIILHQSEAILDHNETFYRSIGHTQPPDILTETTKAQLD